MDNTIYCSFIMVKLLPPNHDCQQIQISSLIATVNYVRILGDCSWSWGWRRIDKFYSVECRGDGSIGYQWNRWTERVSPSPPPEGDTRVCHLPPTRPLPLPPSVASLSISVTALLPLCSSHCLIDLTGSCCFSHSLYCCYYTAYLLHPST